MNKTKSNKSIFIVFLLIMLFGFGLLMFDKYGSESGSQRDIIGNFSSTTGLVEYKDTTYSGWSAVKSNRDVANESTVFTHEKAKANIDIEGVQVVINENSLVKIERPHKVKTLDMSFGSLIFDSKSKETIVLKINNKPITINLDNSRVKITQEKGSEKIKVVSLRGETVVHQETVNHVVKKDQEVALEAVVAEPEMVSVKKEDLRIISPLENGTIYLGKKNKDIQVIANDVIRSLQIEDLKTQVSAEKTFLGKSASVSADLIPGNYKIIAKAEDGRESAAVTIQVDEQKKLSLSYKKMSYKITPTQWAPKVKTQRNLKENTQVYVKKTEDVNWIPVYDDEWRPMEPGSYELVLVQEARQDYESESEHVLVQITEDEFKTIPQPKIRVAELKPEPIVEMPPPKPVIKKKRSPAQVESQLKMVQIGDRKSKISFGSRLIQQSINMSSSFGGANYDSILAQSFFFNYEYAISEKMHIYTGFDYSPFNVSMFYSNLQSNFKKSYDKKTFDFGIGYSPTKWLEFLLGSQLSMNQIVYPGTSGIELLKMDTAKLMLGSNLNFALSSKQGMKLRANVAPAGVFLSKATQMQNLKMQMQYLAGMEYSYFLKSNFFITSDLNYISEGYQYDYLGTISEKSISTRMNYFDLGLRLSYLF